MKILIISQYFFPENFRVNDICKELVKRGHDITVLTGLPNYPDGEIFKGYENAYKQVTEYYGAKVYRCKLRPRHKGTFNLIKNYASFVVQANKKIKELLKEEFDVIFVYGLSPITVGMPAIKYKKKKKIPIVYYNLDIWPDCVRESSNGKKSMSKIHPIYIIAKKVSSYVYKNVDIILNKCDDFSKYLQEIFNIKANKLSVLEEHAEDIYLSINEKPIQNDIIDFMFLGNIGSVQKCEIIIDSFSRINTTKKWLLHFVGDGSQLENIKSYVKEKQMEDKVIFHGKVPIHQVNKFYDIADVCVISLVSETVAGLTPPGKLFGYMAASRPIVGILSGTGKRIIETSDCGKVCEQSKFYELSDILEDVIQNIDDFSIKGVNGRKKFLEKYTLNAYIDSLEKHFENIKKRI